MRICLEAKKRRGTPNQLFISFLRVWFSREELENRLEFLPLEAVFDRECTLQALSEMETSDDPKIAALLRDYSNAWDNCNYLKMLEISEELISVRGSGMDWVKKAAADLWTGNQEEIIESLNKAVAIEPNNAKVWKARGFSFFMMAGILDDTKWIDESLSSCDTSIELDDQDSEPWILKSLLLLAFNKIEESLICVKNSVNLNEDSYDAYLILAINQLNQQDFNNALLSVNKSIALFESNNVSWFLKGFILAQLGLLFDSIKCFDKSLESDTFSNSEFDIFIAQISTDSSAIQCIKLLSKEVINFIFKSNFMPEQWITNSQSILDIYHKHNLLDDLSGGLVESIKAINEPSNSDHTAQAWLEMWQNLAGQYDEFQVALNLLKVAVEYKINRDRRVLLQLPQEERQILEELLNPESP
jgi:tetratricopeptide (TPR) repeat protein